MANETINPPVQLGEIDDGPFGKVPLYMANLSSEVENIYQYRQEHGLSESGDITDEFFFLGATDSYGREGETVSFTSNNVTKKSPLMVSPKVGQEPFLLFKAYYHLVGTFIEPVTSSELGVKSVVDLDSNATFTLPKIPYELASKLDTFFRAVDKKYGTEGIVLLTYDFAFADSDNPDLGWNFGVPDQKNTGGHCDYDKANVIEELEGQTRIVGTVHSHPHMRAYASPTDHNDQAGFDGLHITYGWSASTKGATEYHAEMVRGDNFTWIPAHEVIDLENEYVYEWTTETQVKKNSTIQIPSSGLKKVKREIDVPEQELDTLISRVSKASAVTSVNHGNFANKNKSGAGSGKAQRPTTGQPSYTDPNSFLPKKDLKLRDEPVALQKFAFAEGYDIPDALQNNVLIRLANDPVMLDSCPLCDTVWQTKSQALFGGIEARRQCVGCGVFVLLDDEGLSDMDEVRSSKGYYPLKNFFRYEIPTIIWDLRHMYDDPSWLPEYETIEGTDLKKV